MRNSVTISYSERNFKGFVHRLEEAMDMCFSPLMTSVAETLISVFVLCGDVNEWGKLTTVMAGKWIVDRMTAVLVLTSIDRQ